MDADLRVEHVPEQHLYELVLTEEQDEQVAGYAEYVPTGGAMAITNVVVSPRFGGRGFGTAITEAALDDAKDRGLDVLPVCSFVREHMRRNPDDYLELVPARQRRRFGLAA
jgi:predicted GNAT family acetyltransferase